MKSLVKGLNLYKYIPLIPNNPVIAAENSFRLLSQFGLIDSTPLYKKINSTIEKYTLTENITFYQLYKLTKIKLTLTATNVHIGHTVYFNHLLTPIVKYESSTDVNFISDSICSYYIITVNIRMVCFS